MYLKLGGFKMKKEIIIETLDNGLLFRDEYGCEAVLYRESDIEGEEMLDCERHIGKIFTDEMFEEGELSKKSREIYESTGKVTIGYRVKIDIEPLTEIKIGK